MADDLNLHAPELPRASRPMSRCLSGIALALLLATGAGPAAAQDTRSDSNPMRPILFSVRPEFFKVADDVWRMQLVARYDTAVVRNRRWLGGRRGMLLRFELPLVSADTPSITAQTGLGDAYGQVLLVPHLSSRFAFVAGSGLTIPTATGTALGNGKWTLSPALAPVWFLRGRGLAYVKVQNFTSVAGDASRPDLNFLLITPTLIHTLPGRKWILVDTETKTDWESAGRTNVKSGVQIGWLLPDGIGLWIKPEVWWGPNRGGQWNIKTGIVWYRTGG
jgi:hypothetical protein